MNIKTKNIINASIHDKNGVIEALSIRTSLSGSQGINDHQVYASVDTVHVTTYVVADQDNTDEMIYLESENKTSHIFSSNMAIDIKTVLAQMSPGTENYVKQYEKSTATGRTVGNGSGVDSVAFLELKNE